MPSPDINTSVSSTNRYSWVTRSTSDYHIINQGERTVENSVGFKEFRKTVSVRTPDYERLKRFMLPVNSYSKEHNIFHSPKGVVNLSDISGASVTEYVWNTNYNYMVTPLRGARADDPAQKAISRLIEQVKLAKADAYTSLAEFNKTAAHVAHTATRLHKAISSLRKGHFGDFAKAIGVSYTTRDVRYFKNRYYRFKTSKTSNKSRFDDFMADTWLEYQYGWRPLLMDVHNMAEAAADATVERSKKVRAVRARAHTERSQNQDVVSNQFRKICHSTSRRWIEYGIYYSLPSNISFAQAFGLTNPMLVAWEVVPFSFVADWFLPIGDAISALSAYHGLQFRDGYVSRRDTYDDLNLLVPGPPYTAGSVTYTCQSSNLEQTQRELMITRQQILDWPNYGWPRVKDPLSWSHATSAVALLQSLFRNR